MENKPEGPYKWSEDEFGCPDISGPTRHLDTELHGYRLLSALNIAYTEGFKAGRASRDRLREALVVISSELYVNVDAATRCRQTAKKALAEDEKNG